WAGARDLCVGGIRPSTCGRGRGWSRVRVRSRSGERRPACQTGGMLSASGLAVSHGARTLFSDVTIRLAAGQRVALVGGNGAGKTTLIEILVGLRAPDRGEVHRPKDLRMGYLPQELTDRPTGTVI